MLIQEHRMEKILFTPEDGASVELYILEETQIGGNSYLLVTTEEEGDGEAMIMKCIQSGDGEEVIYEFVEDDNELDAVAKVFESLLEDIKIV